MRDYAKIVNQTTQIVRLSAGGSATLAAPWVAQAQEGTGDLRVSGDDGALPALAPRVIFRVVDQASPPDLTGLVATLQWREQSITGEADPTYQSEDVTGDLLLGGGRLQIDLGDLAIEQVQVVLTQQTATEAKTYLCRVELWGLFAPHRAPAGPQDVQGHGYGGTYAISGVPNVLAERQPRKAQQSALPALRVFAEPPEPWQEE